MENCDNTPLISTHKLSHFILFIKKTSPSLFLQFFQEVKIEKKEHTSSFLLASKHKIIKDLDFCMSSKIL